MTPEDLAGFAKVQQLAYECAEAVAADLEPGITEKETVARMRAWLVDRGVNDWFHLPFAWFGDRTAFTGFRQPFQFFPTNRTLEADMPFVLDVAPVLEGYTADIGFTACLTEHAVLDKVLDDLAEHRALIVDLARQRRRFREI